MGWAVRSESFGNSRRQPLTVQSRELPKRPRLANARPAVFGFNGQLDINDVGHQALMACAANNKQISLRITRQAEEALKSGVTATPTVLIRDNKTGRSLKLEGPANDVMLLSAIDLLIEKGN